MPEATLLHSESKSSDPTKEPDTQTKQPVEHSSSVAPVMMMTSNTQASCHGSPLMMTCQISPDGSSICARRLLDSGSTTSFVSFSTVMEEYIEMKHAETVPVVDLQKPSNSVFYLPMHAVRKEQSTTTKIRAVFDASAK